MTDERRLSRLRTAILDLTAEVASKRFLLQMAISNARNDRYQRPFPRIEARKSAVDAIVMEEIAARGDSPERDSHDMLGHLLAGRETAPENPASDQELCDQLRLLLIGGHDTTAATIAWTLERIAHTPRILPELEHTVRTGDDTLLDAVIHETLRLRPVFPFTVRLTKRPLELDGLTVPAETIVSPYIALVQRRPDVYPDPHAFRPERFVGVRPGTYSWIPFGGGLRRCIGASLALEEARIVLRTLIQELDLRAASDGPEAIRRSGVTTVPERGAQIAATVARAA